ncbi:MAG: hypothetical protein IT330_17065 [Anaerolineae bacterium]|nr:hypothetical protein [Anaerolineae bacterium]
MTYRQESDMYPFVCQWLTGFLSDRHRHATIRVFDSSRKSLSRLIQETGLITNLPPEWPSWDIHVDVVGFALTEKATGLAFVECKNVGITLGHVSQLMGYSRVALPQYSFIVSPQGASDSLRSLLLTFGRLDVLHYQSQAGRLPRSIVVARWDETANCIDVGSLVTNDVNRLGRL